MTTKTFYKIGYVGNTSKPGSYTQLNGVDICQEGMFEVHPKELEDASIEEIAIQCSKDETILVREEINSAECVEMAVIEVIMDEDGEVVGESLYGTYSCEEA